MGALGSALGLVAGVSAGLGLLSLGSCTEAEAGTSDAALVRAEYAPATETAPDADPDDAPTSADESISARRYTEIEPELLYSGELTQGGFVRGTVPAGTAKLMLGDQEVAFAKDGSFFAAFDRDSPASVTLSAVLDGGQTEREELTIAPRDWQIERVNVAKRKLRDPEAYWRQREPEYNAIVAARAKRTGAEGWKQDFIWPVTGRISGRFGRQRIYRGEPGRFHSGIDIAKPTGTPFVAPADGVVILARTGFSLEGGLLMIDHGNGLNSAFLHCHRIHVKEGDSVRQGQHIGDIGSTGRSTGPHLHWGLKWHDARFDPILLAGPMN